MKMETNVESTRALIRMLGKQLKQLFPDLTEVNVVWNLKENEWAMLTESSGTITDEREDEESSN